MQMYSAPHQSHQTQTLFQRFYRNHCPLYSFGRRIFFFATIFLTLLEKPLPPAFVFARTPLTAPPQTDLGWGGFEPEDRGGGKQGQSTGVPMISVAIVGVVVVDTKFFWAGLPPESNLQCCLRVGARTLVGNTVRFC